MQEIAEYERRIAAAMERIAEGIARSTRPAAAEPAPHVSAIDPELVDEQAMLIAQLREKLRVDAAQAQGQVRALQDEMDRLASDLADTRAALAVALDREAETAGEIDAVLAAMTPILEEAAHHA